MRKLLLSFCALCMTISLQAAITKTVNLTTAGTLSAALTDDERNAITDLTVTGNIDARDFVTMREKMYELGTIDLTNATIVAYEGTDGTAGTATTTYAANELPPRAFSLQVINDVPNNRLQSIKLPSSLTAIGNGAFRLCKSITAISIPNSVTTIGSTVFYQCSALSSVTLPSALTTISASLFGSCSSLKEIAIPASVTEIKDAAFQGTGITDIIIPAGVTSIAPYTFESCESLKSISLPSSVTSVHTKSFMLCYALETISVDNANPEYASVDGVLFSKDKKTLLICPNGKKGEYAIPADVTTIAEYAFSTCKYLTKVTIPGSVTEIANYAFSGCQGLTTLTIPASVTTLSKGSFQDCSALTSIILPNTLTQIGEWAFNGCSAVTDLTLPASLTSLLHGSITRFAGLKSFTVLQSTPIDLKDMSYMFDDISRTIPLYVPAGSKAAYAEAELWKEFTNVIEFSCVVSTATVLAKEANSTQTLNVTANTSWTVTATADWLELLPTAEVNGNGSITVTAKTANAGTARTATITLTAVGVPTQTITITQAAGVITSHTANTAEAVILYPNPTSDAFSITTDGVASVEVYSDADLLFTKAVSHNESVSIADLHAGTYIVVVKMATGVSTHTIIKQ